MTDANTAALDGVTEEQLADCPEPLAETVIDLTDRIETLEQTVERYKVLRNIVATKTDLEESTIDQLVDQQLEGGQGR